MARGHSELHRDTSGRHRQIESVLELDLLRLGEAKPPRDVGKRLLWKDDRAWTDGPNAAGKLNIFDGLGEALQSAAILFEEAQSWPIDLAVDEQANQTLVSQHRRERKLSLRAVESRRRFAERFAMNASYVFVRRIAHGGVIAIKVQRSHCDEIISCDVRSLESSI